MERLFKKIEQEFEQVKEEVKEEVEGVFGHKHEEHHQHHQDRPQPEQGSEEVSAEVNTTHRFQSFAPQSSGGAKWYVDGASYFWAVSIALEQARESIYILDWWLSPELYLRRPPAKNEQYRLDNMLRAAAERGVKVHVIVYKEVAQALTLNSEHTKHALEALHPNIKVFRHPDHAPDVDDAKANLETSFSNLSIGSLDAFKLSKIPGDALKALYGSAGEVVLYWAHHEKLCLVDGRLAFMGGLDMCFGRWDTNSHPIADAHPGDLDNIVFPGQDYNNARVFDFEGVQDWNHNQLDRTKSSRMGWSDISISLDGPIVKNLVDHFVDRWNYIFGEKYIAQDPEKYAKLSIGSSLGQREYGYDRPEPTAIQLCRSCTHWSAGHPTEHSIQNAYIDAIRNAQHFVYIENQFFITATGDDQHPVENQIGAAIVERILRAHNEGQFFRVIVLMPAVPAFAGDLHSDGALGTRAIMEFQYNSINRGGQSIMESLQKQGVEDPKRYITFYNLRNYDRINTSETMQRVQDDSGVDYEDARRQFDDRVGVGNYPYEERAGGYGNQYEQYQRAAASVPDATWDSIAACYMDNGPDINRVPWNGNPEAEIDAFVSEELYIHTKVLIADDRLVICGSANLNDRSQLGTHDSEIAVVIEDQQPVETTMNGQPFTASKFAASLRRQLWRKHLGLLPHQPVDRPNANWTPIDTNLQEYDWGSYADRLVADPMSSGFWDLWTSTARTNTEVFNKVFHPVPTDLVRTWDQYDDFFSRHFIIPGVEIKDEDKAGRVDYGHVVRDEFPGGVQEVKEWLSRIKGTLVEMPLEFLIEVEDLAKEGLSLNTFTDELYT
ncbi:putative phospholipase D [Xylariales sp. PMI_506]|nr:putative phospholipase D [Xylariales sp. PMI_506]